MDTFMAFQKGKENIGVEPKVFDWIKAAEIIRDSKVNFAGAGLSGDWEWTGGDIFETVNLFLRMKPILIWLQLGQYQNCLLMVKSLNVIRCKVKLLDGMQILFGRKKHC